MIIKTVRIRIAAGAAALGGALLAAGMEVAWAQPSPPLQTYPARPIRLILPYSVGGATSAIARIFSQKMGENWGQQVLVDNRPGGNTIIGSEAMVKSAPDGHTLLLVTTGHVIYPTLIPNIPYDPVRDFAPVGGLIRIDYMLVVHPSVPATSLKEFIALARARPNQLNSGSVGTGGVQHLANELFNQAAGVKIQHVPYKGGGPAMTDLLGGQIQVTFNNLVNLLPHVKAGKVRALAISGDSRSGQLPQVPTFAEAGLPGYAATNWFGIMAPAATPPDIVHKVGAEIGRIQALPDVRQQFAAQGVEAFVAGPVQFAAVVKSDLARYAKVIQETGIRLDAQ